MGIRPRFLLIFTALGVVPIAALGVFSYWNSVRAVEAELRNDLRRAVAAVSRGVDRRLREREEAIVSLARSPAVRAYVRAGTESGPAPEELPKDLEAEARAVLEGNRKYYAAVTYFGASRRPLFRAEPNFKASPPVVFQTGDSLAAGPEPDERVWATAEQTPLRSSVERAAYGPALRYTVPVFVEEPAGASSSRGALVVDLDLDAVLSEAASVADGAPAAPPPQSPAAATPPARLVIILDRAGNVVYHTNVALKYRPVEQAMPPSFGPAAGAMKTGSAGWQFYDSDEGDRRLAAYQGMGQLDLSVAVIGDYTGAVRGLRWVGWLGTALALLVGLLMAALLWVSLRRTARSIESVTEGAVAIARGNLDQLIEVRSNDETRLLAESFNVMTDRLREQMAREAEARQFQSFMRISAMLTHDLKNSILSLSLLVQNMEEQFHREEFRADAMKSLTEATDKLRALVARLSEPVRTLSGEFGLPRPVDLIPAIRRAIARTADHSAAHHEVSVTLPESLVAVADEERIERVVENLVLNAVEAMGAKSGRLAVLAGAEGEGFVFFSVSDTGPGMTEEFLRTRLFRPFATTKAQGIGLGLYASRELILALGGRIEVESVRGSGTTFRVVLPSGQITGKG